MERKKKTETGEGHWASKLTTFDPLCVHTFHFLSTFFSLGVAQKRGRLPLFKHRSICDPPGVPLLKYLLRESSAPQCTLYPRVPQTGVPQSQSTRDVPKSGQSLPLSPVPMYKLGPQTLCRYPCTYLWKTSSQASGPGQPPSVEAGCERGLLAK